MYFYDEIGSKLFEKITELPEYYLTRTELPLIKKAASYLKETITDVNIIEFGSGDCTKISILLDEIPEEKRQTICYIPFDVSDSAVKESCDILVKKYGGLRIHGIVADFMSQLNVIENKPNKLLCFLGSTIGNFSIDQSIDFLKELKSIMQENDQLLIGFDMVKNKSIIEKAYNDERRITEQFNKNILHVVNKIVDTNFKPDSFQHVAFFNKDQSRIEMHLKAIEKQEINSPRFPKSIMIEKGETIHTENSHKFSLKQIKDIAQKADLEIEKIFQDDLNWFSLAIFTKVNEGG